MVLEQSEIFLRLIVSLMLSLLIGLEREVRAQSAGLRTHVLVCLGSTLFTLTSVLLFDPNVTGADYTRIAAQVVVGIGFIGGGVIFKSNGQVKGLTTASTLWVSAALGLAVGFGFFAMAVFSTVLILIVILLGRWFEAKLLGTKLKKK